LLLVVEHYNNITSCFIIDITRKITKYCLSRVHESGTIAAK